MSYSGSSRARNLLHKARASIEQIQLDPAVYGSLVVNPEHHQITAKLTDRERWRRERMTALEQAIACLNGRASA